MSLFPSSRPARSRSSPAKKKLRRVTTPLVMQMHMTECGAACLGSILAYFGRWVPLTELRNKCGVNRDGSTAAGLARAARQYGLKCTGKSINAGHLADMPLPQILFWEWNHFLILEGLDSKRAYLNDPAMGRRKLSMEEFTKGFSGIALHLSPEAEFQRGGTPPGMLRRLPPWLRGCGGPVSYLLACGLMLAVLALIVPVALGLFVDRVLVGAGPGGAFTAGTLAIAAVFAYGICWLMQRCMKRLAIQISVVAGDRCLSRLLRLPVEYFGQRLASDLTERVMSVDRIAKGLQSHLIELVIEVSMSIVFLAAMLVYDAPLAMVVLGLAVLNAVVARLIERMRTEENHVLRREQSMLIGHGMLMLHQADSLRMTASDDGFFSRWGGHQARELAARQRFVEFGHMSAAVPGLFMILTQTAVLAFGASQVIAGDMTLGTLSAFFVLSGMFLAPIGRFAEFADGWQALAIGMQRIEDITEAKEDSRFGRRNAHSDATTTLNGRLQLSGRLELRGVTFGYDSGRPPLISDIDLVIEPGQRIAVIGASGSGKSTLASLVSGAYEPWSGEILFDGLPRNEIPDEVMVRSLSVVDQRPILFSGTVRENITLWNTAVPDNMVVSAARDACIHDRILDRPLGYEALVDEDGGNFSGGEGQRLEIARALVGNPTVLILDEATSALDADTEKTVDDALRHRGVSCLIVAHRLSTIRDCDEIVVLDKGTMVQRGTHDELINDQDGLYRRLVRAG